MAADPASTGARHRRCPKCHTRFSEATSFCSNDGAALELADGAADDRTGDVIADRYRLVRLIGQGGMGQVYEAAHIHIDKRVAVKLLRREVVASNPGIITRFKQEARAASSIGHPSIVEIEDFAPLPDGGVYLAMELLVGESLAEWLRIHAPVPVDEAVRILCETARGLAAAHSAGIVHRDIKPENIFLVTGKGGGPPQVKILDFGIAKVSSAGPSNLTQTGEVFGTPHYMSPEQALGRPVDARSDIYALGVIAYQLFAGEVPFQADSLLGVLNQHVQQKPPTLTTVVPERATPAIAAAIDRALAKDPAARFQTMGELEAALLGTTPATRPAVQAARGEPSQARLAQRFDAVQGTLTPPPPDAPGPPARSRTPLLIGAAVLLLAGGAAAIVLRPAAPSTAVAVAPSPPPPVSVSPPPPPPEVEKKTDEVIDPYEAPKPKHEVPKAAHPPRAEKAERPDRGRGVEKIATREPVKEAPKEAAKEPAKEAAKEAPKHLPPPPLTPPPKETGRGSHDIDRLAGQIFPGSRRVGAVVDAIGARGGDRKDFTTPLKRGHCYTIVALGAPSIGAMGLFLWDPTGKRVADRKERTSTASLQYCPLVDGDFHVQAKLLGWGGSGGAYQIGVYGK